MSKVSKVLDPPQDTCYDTQAAAACIFSNPAGCGCWYSWNHKDWASCNRSMKQHSSQNTKFIPHHLHDWWFQLVPVPNLANGDHCYREADHDHGCYSLSNPCWHPVQLNHGKRCRQYEPSVALWLRSYFAAQQAFGPDLQEFLLSAGIACRATDISNTE